MPSERFLSALSRIEAAARRLEAGARRPGAAAPAAPPPADDALASRHERLRVASGAALARLDALIAARGGEG